jgi:hypothetical protein
MALKKRKRVKEKPKDRPRDPVRTDGTRGTEPDPGLPDADKLTPQQRIEAGWVDRLDYPVVVGQLIRVDPGSPRKAIVRRLIWSKSRGAAVEAITVLGMQFIARAAGDVQVLKRSKENGEAIEHRAETLGQEKREQYAPLVRARGRRQLKPKRKR